jgi:hypothetical protein
VLDDLASLGAASRDDAPITDAVVENSELGTLESTRPVQSQVRNSASRKPSAFSLTLVCRVLGMFAGYTWYVINNSGRG